jgi:hypothetical protein
MEKDIPRKWSPKTSRRAILISDKNRLQSKIRKDKVTSLTKGTIH